MGRRVALPHCVSCKLAISLPTTSFLVIVQRPSRLSESRETVRDRRSRVRRLALTARRHPPPPGTRAAHETDQFSFYIYPLPVGIPMQNFGLWGRGRITYSITGKGDRMGLIVR